jgi:hypothetical protein
LTSEGKITMESFPIPNDRRRLQMKQASKLLVPLLAIFALSSELPAEAASHREAPLI